jgi:UDP-N-acetylglucosamine/UDP-N-acetylgalactosamine diphosphorylase
MQRKEIPERLLKALQDSGQQAALRFWDDLDASARKTLVEQLERMDLEKVKALARGDGLFHSPDTAGPLVPAPVVRVGEDPDFATHADAIREGRELLARGKIGIILVAGGQGSRLGFEGPKGCLPVGVFSGKTLFQLHAESIGRLSSQFEVEIPWYIMTSVANDGATRAFFSEHEYFGLPPDSVVFFRQGMLPALDADGKLLLESRERIFLSPDGHGGVYPAFLESGGLDDAERRGVEHLFYFQVDNPLVRIADPLYLGLHSLSRAEMSLKVLRKSEPYEKLGVVTVDAGRHRIIEYSDLPAEEAELRDPSGELHHWAGSIAIHVFHLPFFRRVATGARSSGGIHLPFHIAKKKIPSLDSEGRPTEVEGRKYETFVFDALPFAERVLNLEVVREREFAPIKNRTGVDSLESSRELLLAEHGRWLREAGVQVDGGVEVSPRAALSADDLRESLPPNAPRHAPGNVHVERASDGTVRIEPV